MKKMSKETVKVLETIVDLEGDCLDYDKHCHKCPFKKGCLVTFIDPVTRMTSAERFILAIDTLINNELLDEYDPEDIREHFQRRKNQ